MSTPQGPVLIDANRGDAGARDLAPVPLAVVRVWLGAWLGNPATRGLLAGLVSSLGATTYGLASSPDHRAVMALRDRLERAFARGELRARRVFTAMTVGGGGEPEEEEPAPAAEVRPDDHWVDFTFVYPDGSPAKGYDYELKDPQQQKERGTLGDDATIHKESVRVGLYEVALKDVEQVSWEQRQIRCDEEATLLARVSGFAEGASARVRIFREHLEGDDEAIATLSAPVVSGGLSCTWRYEYAADDARKAEQGVARFVGEVSLEGGKYWNKTSRRQLAVQLKSLVSVRWGSARVADGEDAEVVVVARGYAPGAQVALELWVSEDEGGERKLVDLPAATIEGDTARATVPFRRAASLDDAAAENNEIHQPGAYFVRAVIEDDVRRAARSDLLVCDDAQQSLSA